MRNCFRTCLEDSVKFVSFVEIIAAVAALVFVGIILERDHIFANSDWKHLNHCWVVYSLFFYALALILCGTLGMIGSSICKGLCLDLVRSVSNRMHAYKYPFHLPLCL